MGKHRSERRNNDPAVLAKRQQFYSIPSQGITLPNSGANNTAPGAPFGNLPLVAPNTGGYGNLGGGSVVWGNNKDAGGWGVGLPGAKPASGQAPSANPYITPKATGLTRITQTYPSNYFQVYDISTWRYACDQATNMGDTRQLAAMYIWCYTSSAFVQGLFEKLGDAIDAIDFKIVDKSGNKIDSMQEEFCDRPWQKTVRKEILWAFFWGFTGLNFDPPTRKVYKYPQQQIDPINRFLKNTTFSPYDGVNFSDLDNVLFIQHSTNIENQLGWMQPICRSFIQINQSKNNWLAAGRRLAYPIMTVGYPQNDNAITLTNGQQVNQYKVQAEEIASEVDPSKGFVYPYTVVPGGEIQKSIEIDFAETKAGQNMYKVYSEFNDDEKNEIREWLLGGTLASSASKSGSGSRSLGEVHERMFKAVVKSKLPRVLAVLNDDYVPKLAKFYTGLPAYWAYDYDKAEQLTFEEMTSLSSVVTANGKRLTNEFFEANGVAREYIEDAPEPVVAPKPGTEKPTKDPDPQSNSSGLHYAIPKGFQKKKYW